MQSQVVLLAKDVAQRMANLFGRDQVSSHLVKHRLESVIIMLVNQCDLGIGLGQLLRRAETGKPPAQNEHLWFIAHSLAPLFVSLIS